MIRCALLLALLALPCTASAASYYFCEYFVPNLPPGAKPNTYFDRTLALHPEDGHANFEDGDALNFSHSGNMISASYLAFAGKRRGHYRKIFMVYRFDAESQVLIHSYVYFVNADDYRNNFRGFEGPAYRRAEARNMVTEQLPEGYMWVAWDKSHWNCQQLSYWMYLLRSLERGIIAVLSV